METESARSLLRRALPVLALLALAGCGASGPVRCHPVSGQVLYDGKPAVGVRVYLLPTSAPMVPQIPNNPHGVTGSDGRFTLTTYTEGDGAPEGGYQLLLSWPAESSESEESDFDRLLGWYDGAHSKETAHVKAGNNELPPIRIRTIRKPPQASEGVPGRN